MSKHLFCNLTPVAVTATIIVWTPRLHTPYSGQAMGSLQDMGMRTHASATICANCNQPTLHWMAATATVPTHAPTAAEPAFTTMPEGPHAQAPPSRMRLCPPCWRRLNLGPIIPPMVNHD